MPGETYKSAERLADLQFVPKSHASLQSKTHLDTGEWVKNSDLGGLHTRKTTPYKVKRNKEYQGLALGQQLQNALGYLPLEE